MSGSHKLRAAVSGALILVATSALAQEAESVVARANAIEQRKPRRFEIAPQPLSSAVIAFARAADVDHRDHPAAGQETVVDGRQHGRLAEHGVVGALQDRTGRAGV